MMGKRKAAYNGIRAFPVGDQDIVAYRFAGASLRASHEVISLLDAGQGIALNRRWLFEMSATNVG